MRAVLSDDFAAGHAGDDFFPWGEAGWLAALGDVGDFAALAVEADGGRASIFISRFKERGSIDNEEARKYSPGVPIW